MTIGIWTAVFVCIGSTIMALGMVGASRLLHEGILRNILYCPMLFFDVTPIGRILNRFGKDVEMLDSRLPSSIMTFIGAIIQTLMIISMPIYATPSVILLLVPVFVFYSYLLRFYVSTSRQLKRLESASRSPIFSHFQESIQGASTIRAYKLVDEFIKESERRVDENLATYYPSIVANRLNISSFV
uniref:ABC transmembrane type-1 domain-containing protein n=1 Tax=Angiostrongylus cantonensis TaxID=6313 RepID=A0A0K0D460_ANGCA